MTVSISVLTAGLWLAFAQSTPAMVPAAVGKCMWDQFPEAARAAIVSKPTIDAAFEELNVRINGIGPAGLLEVGRVCGVASNQFRAAGSRVADHAGRLWAERQLAQRASPQQLDQAYRAISAADKQAFQQNMTVQGGLQKPPAKAAFERLQVRLGIPAGDQGTFSALANYLISRVNSEQ